MNFRGRRQQQVNDGLPVINGKKVKHRFKSISSPYKNSSSGSSTRLWVLLTAVAAILLVLNGNSDGDVDNQTVQAPPVAKSSAAAPNANIAKAVPVVPAAPVVPATPVKPAAPAMPSLSAEEAKALAAKLPPKCTQMQLRILSKQLPPSFMQNRVNHRTSFSIATAHSESPFNAVLAREFYASKDFKLNTSVHSFFGVSFGWYGYARPVDMLAIGSRDPNKYKAEGMSKAPPAVPIDVSEGTRPAKYVVVQFEPQKDNLEIPKLDGLVGLKNPPAPHKAIEQNWPQVNGKTAADQPIHYMELNSAEGKVPSLLNQLLKEKIIQRTRFMHIVYDHRGEWGETTQNKLSVLTRELRQQGMVCYWAGKKEADYALWRFTDCWLDLFDVRKWSYISCVNVLHEDTKVLADRMEQKFLETLTKDHVFEGT